MGPVDEENIGGSAGGGGDRSSGERISQRGEKLSCRCEYQCDRIDANTFFDGGLRLSFVIVGIG